LTTPRRGLKLVTLASDTTEYCTGTAGALNFHRGKFGDFLALFKELSSPEALFGTDVQDVWRNVAISLRAAGFLHDAIREFAK
jgi:hypothetical protein